jgi:hypothetical protein
VAAEVVVEVADVSGRLVEHQGQPERHPLVSEAAVLVLDRLIAQPVGFENSVMGSGLRVQAARSYSLISPPSTGRRLIRRESRSGAGRSGRGG